MTRTSERGEVSLIALLIAMVLMVIVTMATLGLLDGVSSVAADGTRRTDAQDGARSGIDRVTAALRNLASPTTGESQAIDVLAASNLVFRTVDPAGPNAGANATNTMRVRYCLGPDARVWEQRQTWTSATAPATPTGQACPGAGWTSTQVLVDDVANASVPVFTYDTQTVTQVSGIHVELLVDTDPGRRPGPTRLASGVFLRNQNRAPVASFVVSRSAGRAVLNGSGSSDPEGRPLSYEWFDGATAIGTGITLSYPVTTGTVHQFSLRVGDPAGLTAVSATQSVTG